MEQRECMKVFVKPKRTLEDFDKDIQLDRLLVSYMLSLGSAQALRHRHEIEFKLHIYPPNEKWRLEEEIVQNKDSITALNRIVEKILDRNLVH
jgi:hypothetical protein